MTNNGDANISNSDDEVINISAEDLFPQEDDMNISDEELFPQEDDEEVHPDEDDEDIIPESDDEELLPDEDDDEELHPGESDDEDIIPESDDEELLPDEDDDEELHPGESDDDDIILEDDDEDYISPDDYDEHSKPVADDPSDDTAEQAEKKRIIIRGPGYAGEEESFDKYCVFGNEVELNLNQAMQLRSYTDGLPRSQAKGYVCRLTEQCVMPEQGSMEFTQEYTSNHLRQFLMDRNAVRFGIPGRTRVVSLAVKMKESSVIKYCRLELSDEGKAVVRALSKTTGWPVVVRAFNLRHGDICMFSFTDESHLPARLKDPLGAWIKMEILKLEE